jgi:hypothetical protein
MGNERYAFVLECKDDPRRPAHFLLGYAASQRTFDSQQMWPKEMWPLAVLCNGCSTLFEYTEQDIQMVPVHSMDPATRLPTKTWCIEVQCGQRSCGSLRKIYFQARSGIEKEEIEGKLDGNPARCLTCGLANKIDDLSCKNVYVVMTND